MQFDFDRFSKIAASVYQQGNPYELRECLEMFRCYFQTYEEYMGHPHPPIKASQIASIMQNIPFLEPPNLEFLKHLKEPPNHDVIPDIEPCIYPLLIQLHFKTKYRHCDYNINHFFSGRIRELRLHEADAGYE